MKLSEAIDRLQKIKDEHGDVWICCKMSGKDQVFEGDAIVDITFLRYAGAPLSAETGRTWTSVRNEYYSKGSVSGYA